MFLIILLAIGFLICAIIDIALDRVNDRIQRDRFFSQFER